MPVRLNGLAEVVEGTDGGDVVVGEPSGDADFPGSSGVLAGAGDAGDDATGEPEDRVLPEPDGLSAPRVDPRLVTGIAQHLSGLLSSGRGHDAATTVWMRWRNAATSGVRQWRWA